MQNRVYLRYMQRMMFEIVKKLLNYACIPHNMMRPSICVILSRLLYGIILFCCELDCLLLRRVESMNIPISLFKSFPFFLQFKYISCVKYTVNSLLYCLVLVSSSHSMPWTGTYYDREFLYEILVIKLLPELQIVIMSPFFLIYLKRLFSLCCHYNKHSLCVLFGNMQRILRALWSSVHYHINGFQHDAGCGTSAFDPGSSAAPFTRCVRCSIKRNHLSPSSGKRSALFTTAVTLLFKPSS
jgi:hypothetical protein